jgi:hypothetical protein
MIARELRGTEPVMKQPSKGGWRRALDSAEASFVAESELLGMREKSIPRTILVACGQPNGAGFLNSRSLLTLRRGCGPRKGFDKFT